MVGFEVGRKLRQQFVREGVALASTKQSGGLFVGKAATGGNPVIRTKRRHPPIQGVFLLLLDGI